MANDFRVHKSAQLNRNKCVNQPRPALELNRNNTNTHKQSPSQHDSTALTPGGDGRNIRPAKTPRNKEDEYKNLIENGNSDFRGLYRDKPVKQLNASLSLEPSPRQKAAKQNGPKPIAQKKLSASISGGVIQSKRTFTPRPVQKEKPRAPERNKTTRSSIESVKNDIPKRNFSVEKANTTRSSTGSSPRNSSSMESPGNHLAKLLEPEYEVDYSDLGLSGHGVGFDNPQNTKLANLMSTHQPEKLPDGYGQFSMFGHNDDIKVSAMFDELEPANLEHILGQDRFKRLLKNFEESDWTMTDGESQVSDVKQNKYTRENDLELDSYRSTSEMADQNQNVNCQFGKNNPDLDISFELETHRPVLVKDQDPVYVGTNVNFQQSNSLEQKGHQGEALGQKVDHKNWAHPSASSDDVIANAKAYIQRVKENAKVAFSLDQIYAKAESMVETDILDRHKHLPEKPSQEHKVKQEVSQFVRGSESIQSSKEQLAKDVYTSQKLSHSFKGLSSSDYLNINHPDDGSDDLNQSKSSAITKRPIGPISGNKGGGGVGEMKPNKSAVLATEMKAERCQSPHDRHKAGIKHYMEARYEKHQEVIDDLYYSVF